MAGLMQQTEALVLRCTNYGEADRIVSLLTRDQGIQKGFAGSARKSRKRFVATLEPFTHALFTWRPGRGNFWALQNAELIDAHYGLRADFQRLALAAYAVELVELLLTEGESQPLIYELLSSFLEFLACDGDSSTARLLFELRLIYLLGYIPHLLHCSECLRIFKDEPIRFDATRGGCLCLDCARGTGLSIHLGTAGSLSKSLRVVHTRFAGFCYGSMTIREAEQILHQVLQQILPREPKSLRFLGQLNGAES